MPALPVLARYDDHELMRRHRAGIPGAREAMIRRHLPLARRLARRYRRGTEPLDDLYQVAALGLVKAVDRWDPDRGAAFSTFAVPTVLGDLRRYFRDTAWAVRPPRDLQELALAADRARGRLTCRLGRVPTTHDIGVHLDRPAADVAEALVAVEARFANSLDEPVLDEPGEPETLGDRSGDDDPGYARVDAAAQLESMLSVLDMRAREVVRLRFADDLLQREIAARLGVSQMHVSRVLNASLKRLHACAPLRGYAPSPAAS
jgi:RNA polymerase sigma-B factor